MNCYDSANLTSKNTSIKYGTCYREDKTDNDDDDNDDDDNDDTIGL